MTPQGQTVLVTGGAGFIGSHLADALVADNEVRVLDWLAGGTRDHVPEAATFIEGDVRDADDVAEAMAGVDLVYHQAAEVSVARSVEAPLESGAINITGTLNILEAARREDARAVVASSAAIYGHPETVPVSETDATEPLSPYGLEKLTADRYARLYHDLYGLPTVAIRPFNAYGPRQSGGPYSGVITVFLEQALAGEPITIEGDGTQTRDFVHVSDLVDAYLTAGTMDAVGESFNVGNGSEVTINYLAETIVAVTESDSEITHVDPRPGDIDRSFADISKAREVLGFEPTVNLHDGLESLVDTVR
jgi:UDP-glucose 4-epimerase